MPLQQFTKSLCAAAATAVVASALFATNAAAGTLDLSTGQFLPAQRNQLDLLRQAEKGRQAADEVRLRPQPGRP